MYEAVNGTASQFGSYDALGRVPTMKADDGLVVSARIYNAYSGALEGECKRFDAGVSCVGTSVNTTTDLFRTDLAAATYQGPKLKTFTDSLTGTSYLNEYLAGGRLTKARATPTGGVGALTQDWEENFAFNGVGSIDSVQSLRNLFAATTPRPRQTVTEDYTPVSEGAGVVLDKLANIKRSAVDGAGNPVSIPGTGIERFAYDLLGHLTEVSRNSGTERLYYAPGGELLYRQDGERFSFYVGEYASVTANGATGCSSTNTCAPLVTSVKVDAHVVFAGTRVASARSDRTLFYYRTRLGSVVATSLNGGRRGAEYRYTPYGTTELAIGESESTRSELGYANAIRLSGYLLHLNARVYDTQARAFLQCDSVDRLRYAYVRGDPINASDPTGLEPKAEEGGRPQYSIVQDGDYVRLVETSEDGEIKVVADADLGISTQREAFAYQLISLQTELRDSTIPERVGGWVARLVTRATRSAFDAVTNWAVDLVGTRSEEYREQAEANRDYAGAEGSAAIGEFAGEVAEAAVEEAQANAAFAGMGSLRIVGKYKELRKLALEPGIERHHVIEKRFAALMEQKSGDMIAAPLSRAEHQEITNLWRQVVKYGTRLETREDLSRAARQVYHNYPDMLKLIADMGL